MALCMALHFPYGRSWVIVSMAGWPSHKMRQVGQCHACYYIINDIIFKCSGFFFSGENARVNNYLGWHTLGTAGMREYHLGMLIKILR